MMVRKCVATCCTLVVFSMLAGGVALAQTSQPQPAVQTPSTDTVGQLPKVTDLQPFSAGADYMSLPGYLRYVAHQQTNQWLTYGEAARIVQQQRGL